MGKRLIAIATVLCVTLTAGKAFAVYSGDLRRATKSARIYSPETMEAKLIWHATFFSNEFRRSFERKHVKIHHMGALEAARFVQEEEYRQGRGWDFFIGFYTKDDYKKFSNEPDTFWRIQLKTANGEVVAPTSIEMIPVGPYERIMYPYLNRWSKGYRVTFPKVVLGRRFSVTLMSIVGQSTLTWKVK
jgi:hypothetical protein